MGNMGERRGEFDALETPAEFQSTIKMIFSVPAPCLSIQNNLDFSSFLCSRLGKAFLYVLFGLPIQNANILS